MLYIYYTECYIYKLRTLKLYFTVEYLITLNIKSRNKYIIYIMYICIILIFL